MDSNTLSTYPTSSSETSGSNGRMIALHLLCPSFQPPSRFTINELPLSSTVADLKSRISHLVPNRPSPQDQRLIYRGKLLSNPDVSLSNVLEPQEASEHSLHLVLPPAPPPSASVSAVPDASAQTPHVPQEQPNRRPLNYRYPSLSSALGTQGLRYRGPANTLDSSEADFGLALQRNAETLRRQVELQARGRWPLRQGLQDTVTMGHIHPASSQPVSPQMTTSQQTSQNPVYQPSPATIPSLAMSRPPVTTMPVYPDEPATNIQLPEDPRLRVGMLQHLISSCEAQLNQGVAPSINSIIRIRTHLLSLLDNQYRSQVVERDGIVESLLQRIFNVYTRADQLRLTQRHQNPTPTPVPESRMATSSSPDPSRAPAYLLSSPSGYQALVAPPHAIPTAQTWLSADRPFQPTPPAPAPGPTHTANVNPMPNPIVLENVVRQAILNQRLRDDGQAVIARNMRRVWLFIRLYFFCYVFSEPGTWSRIFLVSLAVLLSFLSETGIPQQLSNFLVTPVQRHLEGLLQFGADEPLQQPPQVPRTRAGNEATETQPAATSQAAAAAATETSTVARDRTTSILQNTSSIRHDVRRIERSLALFLASLIPGVGERQVEARNAAEAARNAQRVQAEEEERRRRQDSEQRESGAEGEQSRTTEEDTHTTRQESQ